MNGYGHARQDFDAIPIIDISGIDTPDKRRQIGADLVAAAEQTGFFYIKGHSIAPADMTCAFSASKKFFDLPADQKQNIAVDQNQRGWLAQGLTNLEGSKTHDAKEVFFWGWDVARDDPDVLAGVPLVAPNQWPDTQAPWLKPDLLAYYHQVANLGRDVLSALAVGLGQDAGFFDKAYQKPLARGQLVYYPAATKQDAKDQRYGAAEHSDFGVLTILLQDMQGGLQVKNLAGDWVEAPPVEGTFVCNIGDLLERWTNNRLVSTKHRVLNRSGQNRYSIPVFFDPASQTVIDPADFGVSKDALRYPPITAGEYIVGRNKKNFDHYKK